MVAWVLFFALWIFSVTSFVDHFTQHVRNRIVQTFVGAGAGG